MYLANPAAYITAATFKTMPIDYDLTPYSDPQIQDILNRASAKVNSIIKRDLLAKERVIRELGNGDSRLELRTAPLLYIKKIQIVVPGSTGPLIPVDQVLIDYTSGSILQYTPLYYNGQGYFSRFPKDIPVDFTVGSGYGYTISSPSYTTSDMGGSNGLPAGTYNVAISTKTMFGETAPTVRQVTTASGNILVVVAETLGAYLYRAYISSAANNTTLNGATLVGATSFVLNSVGTIAVGDVLLFDSGANAEYLTVASVNAGTKTVTTTTGAVNAHSNSVAVIEQPKLCAESPFTAYGLTQMQIGINSLSAPSGIYQDVLPLADTASAPVPSIIIEATRLLAMSILYEQNNLANRGVYTTRTNRKEISFKSTEGNSGRGVPLMEEQAAAILRPFQLQAIF